MGSMEETPHYNFITFCFWNDVCACVHLETPDPGNFISLLVAAQEAML